MNSKFNGCKKESIGKIGTTLAKQNARTFTQQIPIIRYHMRLIVIARFQRKVTVRNLRILTFDSQ